MSEKRQEISSKPKSIVSERGSGVSDEPSVAEMIKRELAKISANTASATAKDKEHKRKGKKSKKKLKKKSAGPADADADSAASSTNRTKYSDGYNLLDRMKLDRRHKNFVKLDDYNVKGEFPNTCFLV